MLCRVLLQRSSASCLLLHTFGVSRTPGSSVLLKEASTAVSFVKTEPQPVAREFYGCIRQIRSSPRKLNLVAKLIRRMRIGEALAQVEFCEKKAARFVQMVLLDTQRRAVHEEGAHPLKLWVAESYAGKGTYIKRISYHGKGMSGIRHNYHSHYFLTLREGKPPKKEKNKDEQWSRLTRKWVNAGPRSIPNSL